jgi:hypothetical protein
MVGVVHNCAWKVDAACTVAAARGETVSDTASTSFNCLRNVLFEI